MKPPARSRRTAVVAARVSSLAAPVITATRRGAHLSIVSHTTT
ncbi:MAG TPA: hypothetical protein VHE61_05720 [Opitutaceae bacterium]|nr:hypothetical protein [Opitutaceae bacterium]